LCKRNWQGDKRCSFCSANEDIPLLFFDCPLARYVWSLIAMVLGAKCRPISVDQYWVSVKSIQFYPGLNNFIWLGCRSAAFWAIWISRNKVCFEAKQCRSPTGIICLAAYFLSYWAGLQKPEDKGDLEAGAEALKAAALHFHPQEATPEDDGAGC